jgi:hypothetical protein
MFRELNRERTEQRKDMGSVLFLYLNNRDLMEAVK